MRYKQPLLQHSNGLVRDLHPFPFSPEHSLRAKVSRVFTENVRGMAEAESAPDDFRRIEAVIADAEIRNHFEVGIKIEFGFGYFEVGRTNKDINAGTEFGRCFGRELITIENFS